MKIFSRLGGALLLSACLLQPTLGWAVTLGQIDTFQDGTLQNWDAGLGGTEPPFPPEIIPGGGPGDAFMQITALGGEGPGSKISVVNRNAQWSGNYPAAGVNAITMSLKNTGPNNLQVRLVIGDVAVGSLPPLNIGVSTEPFFLPIGSDWVTARFPIGPGHLTAARGNVLTALANAGELRIIHNEVASFPPPPVLGRLGVDNIKAVNNSSQSAWLFLLLD